MANTTKEHGSGSWAWWVGGVLAVGLGLAIHKMLDFDIDAELDWDNLPA